MSQFTKLLASLEKDGQKKMLGKLMAIAFVKTKDEFESENLVQETLLKALEKQDQFSGEKEENLYQWLSVIMRNTHTDSWRRGTFVDEETSDCSDVDNKKTKKTKRVKREINVIEQVPERGMIDDTSTLLVRRDAARCLAKLSDIQNEIISLRQNDNSFDEISQDLGITSGNARLIYLRAKDKYIYCMNGGVT